MKIVFCYYDEIQFDARAQETISLLKLMGTIHFVSYQNIDSKDSDVIYYPVKKRNYWLFLQKSKKTIKQIQPDIVMLHDRYCACLIPYIKINSKHSAIMYDMSEMYIGKGKKGLKGYISKRMLSDPELKYLSEVDVVFSPVIERAMIAKGYFGLKQVPIIFDNIHRIDEKYDKNSLDKKYESIFLREDSKKGLYSGGLSTRGRDVKGLIKAFIEIGCDYELIIAGKYSDDSEIDDLLKHDNIHYVGKVGRGELKYIYSMCDFNFVLFNDDTINNIFCASGKLYEGLFEGCPAIMSPNPPHKRIAEENKIGTVINDGNYVEAIMNTVKELQYYKSNVKEYIDKLDYDNRIINLKERVVETLHDRKNKN